MITKLTPEQHLQRLLECIDKYNRHEISLKEFSNSWADYWRYYVGVNVIPALSIGKKPIVTWKEYQDTPISDSQHGQWKNEGRFIGGLALIMGKVWHRNDLEGYYLAGIDCDNQLAIDELLTINGNPRTIEQFSRTTIVEQQENNKDKLHFYIYTVDRKINDKTSDIANKDFDRTNLPKFEVKTSSGFLMYPSPSNNKENFQRKILGTYNPIVIERGNIIGFQEHIDGIVKNTD